MKRMKEKTKSLYKPVYALQLLFSLLYKSVKYALFVL